MALNAPELKKTQLLIVLSGPSGAGKDSVVRLLLERETELVFVVTTTTRPMREDEKQGFDYFFVMFVTDLQWENVFFNIFSKLF